MGTDNESQAQRAARLRREKRSAQGDSQRLSQITNISGRQQDLQPQRSVQPPSLLDSSDPPEIDISRTPPPTFTSPSSTSIPAPAQSQSSQEAQLRSLLSGQGQQDGGAGQDPFLALMQQAQRAQNGGSDGGNGSNNNDPMMQLLQQMFQPPPSSGSSIPGSAGTPGGPPDGLPPGLAALLNPGGAGGNGAAAPAKPSTSSYIWRILHAIFSLLLGAYIAFVLPFDGSKSERESPLAVPTSVFWIFATVELGLQSGRYMLERGSGGGLSGWMGTVVGFLPPPYGDYVRLAARYSGYWTTLVEDAMGVVFVLGVVAWWKGAVEF